MGRIWHPRPLLIDHHKAINEGWADHPVCQYCGGRVDKPRRTWCSKLCIESYGILVNWYSARRFAWERAGRRCSECGCRVNLHQGSQSPPAEIHHIIPRADGGTDEPSNLACLCPGCHAEYTADYARIRAERRAA